MGLLLFHPYPIAMNKHKTIVLIAALFPAYVLAAKPTWGFIENKGQIIDQCGRSATEVRFLWPTGQGVNVQVLDNGLSYDRYRPSVLHPDRLVFRRLDMRFEGASAMPRMVVGDTRPDRLNFIGKSADVRGARHHGQVRLEELYPGVDLDLRIVDRSLKYDIVVEDARDLDQVRIRYAGFDAMRVQDDEIIFTLGEDELVERIPASWIGSDRRAVQVTYRLVEQGEGHAVLGLRMVSAAEPALRGMLVVDPVVVFKWGTYHGGDLAESAQAIATDRHGFNFVVGRTSGAPTFVTTESFQTVYGGGDTDAFISRIAPQGSRIWTTYYGGEGDDEALAVAVDARFRTRVVGLSSSPTGMATDSSAQFQLAGASDAFIALFDSSGMRVWGSYVGGMADEALTDVFAYPNDRSCACGWTDGADLLDTVAVVPVLPHAGGRDGFVLCFDATGQVERATFIGGPGDDQLEALVVGRDSIFHLAGSTTGILPFSSDTARGATDAIYLTLDTGLQVLSAGLFGGAAEDGFNDVVPREEDVLLCGHTRSAGLADSTALFTDTLGGTDALLVRYGVDGTLLGATYLGGPGDDRAHAMLVDPFGWIFLGGSTIQPVVDTSGVPSDTLFMPADAFIAVLQGTDSLSHISIYGGEEEEVVGGIAMYGPSLVSIAGGTRSVEQIAFQGFQMASGGDEDAFVALYETDRSTPCYGISGGGVNGPCSGGGCAWWNGGGGGGPWEPEPEPFLAVCLGDSVTLCTSGGWLAGGHYWMWYHSECGDPQYFMEIGPCVTFLPTQDMVVFVRSESATSTGECTLLRIVVDSYPVAVATGPDLVCQGEAIELQGEGGVTQEWSGPNGFLAEVAQASAPSDGLQGPQSYVFTAASTFGCLAHDTVSVFVQALPALQWSLIDPLCHGGEQGSIALIGDTLGPSGITFQWPALPAEGSALDSLAAGAYAVIITDTLGCQRSDTLVLVQPPHPLDTVLVTTATCGAANGAIEVLLLAEAGLHSFTWGDTLGASALISGLPAGTYNATYTHPEGCSYQVQATVADTGSFSISVSAVPVTIMQGDSSWLELVMSPEQVAASISWSPPIGLGCDSCASTYAAPMADVTYLVQVTSTLGCIAADSIAIKVLMPPVPAFFLPTHFSPNGDGLNDAFQALGGNYTRMRMVVLDVSGQEVFVAEGERPLWDGGHRGSPAAAGPYQVLLQATSVDGSVEVFDHQVTLMR
jgi:hypothetical protein